MTKTDSFPCTLCGGKCCYYPTFSKKEFKKVRNKYGVPHGTTVREVEQIISLNPAIKPGDKVYVPTLSGGRCPYLVNGACSIYKDRPKVCKDYGIVPQMPCQFLYPELASQKTKEMMDESKRVAAASNTRRR